MARVNFAGLPCFFCAGRGYPVKTRSPETWHEDRICGNPEIRFYLSCRCCWIVLMRWRRFIHGPDRPSGRGQRLMESPVKRLKNRLCHTRLPARNVQGQRGAGSARCIRGRPDDRGGLWSHAAARGAGDTAAGCINVHASCCLAGAVLPLSSVPSWPATGKRASASCRWTPGLIPVRCLHRPHA